MGSIPIARSITPVDAVELTGFSTRKLPVESPFLDAVGRDSGLNEFVGRGDSGVFHLSGNGVNQALPFNKQFLADPFVR